MNDNSKTVDALREYYQSGKTKPYEFRKKALEDLKEAILNNEEKIYEAMKADLGKSAYESTVKEFMKCTKIERTLTSLSNNRYKTIIGIYS